MKKECGFKPERAMENFTQKPKQAMKSTTSPINYNDSEDYNFERVVCFQNKSRYQNVDCATLHVSKQDFPQYFVLVLPCCNLESNE